MTIIQFKKAALIDPSNTVSIRPSGPRTFLVQGLLPIIIHKADQGLTLTVLRAINVF